MYIRLLLLIVTFISLSACSSLPPQASKTPEKNMKEAHVPSWYYAQFRIPRPIGESPKWEIGTMIAGEIIQPVLKKYRDDIQLWRFHRRAGDDKHGHVFSFIFYTDSASAKRIYQAIENQPSFALLKEHNIEWLGTADLQKKNKTKIEDTSDPIWSENLQKNWPTFIMGVSETWLGLVVDLASKQKTELPALKRYENTQKELSTLWLKQGKHAFFHHINAIFAYQPLWMNF